MDESVRYIYVLCKSIAAALDKTTLPEVVKDLKGENLDHMLTAVHDAQTTLNTLHVVLGIRKEKSSEGG